MTTVEAAFRLYWTSPYPLAVFLIVGASLGTLAYLFLTNARNAKLRVSALTGLYGLSTFFWLFVMTSLVLCVRQRDMIAYQTSGIQIVLSIAIGVGLTSATVAGLYVWHRAPRRILDTLLARYPSSSVAFQAF